MTGRGLWKTRLWIASAGGKREVLDRPVGPKDLAGQRLVGAAELVRNAAYLDESNLSLLDPAERALEDS